VKWGVIRTGDRAGLLIFFPNSPVDRFILDAITIRSADSDAFVSEKKLPSAQEER